MDDVVRRAMARWPNVPDVFGWLRLDRRGRWLLRTGPGDDPRLFQPIGNAAFNDFISRNYQSDARGRWYFQNGPQRVFVGLDFTPWVFRLDDAGRDWLAHTGAPAGPPRRLLIDELDQVLLVFDSGPGVVLDRDLEALFRQLTDERGAPIDIDRLLEPQRTVGERQSAQRMAQHVELARAAIAVERVDSSTLPARFGYVLSPES